MFIWASNPACRCHHELICGGKQSAQEQVNSGYGGETGGGWYLDNRANPTAMLLCPTTCAADADAVEVDLSCVRLKG